MGDYLEDIKEKFKILKGDGENIVNYAKNIVKKLEKLEKMFQATDKEKIEDERIKKLKEERAFINDEVNPELEKLEESWSKFTREAQKTKKFLDVPLSGTLEMPQFVRHDAIDEYVPKGK